MECRRATARLAVIAGLLLLALWQGGMLWATDRGIRNIEARSTLAPPAPDPGAAWRTMRFFGDPDAYCWLAYARDLRSSGHWRVRYTFADNAPYGREVHWAQLPIWSLAGLSFALEQFGSLPPTAALEWAGRLLMPLTGFLFGAGMLLILARWTNAGAALLAALALATTSYYDFHTLRPDHHGFQIAFAMGSLVCLLGSGLGWYRESAAGTPVHSGLLPVRSAARRRFAAAGVLAGMAFWLGATVFMFLLCAMVAGVAIALLRAKPADIPADAGFDPGLFRIWGIAGAGTALFFYLLEYAPAHFAMRLEVNHPLYALCFLGTAECLRALAAWKRNRAAFRRRDGWLAALGLLAAAALPALILFGPVAWYAPRTPLMLRLHARFIIEFVPLWAADLRSIYREHLPLLLLGGGTLVMTGFLFRRGRIPFACQAPLRLLAVLCIWITLLFHWQGRWLQFLGPLFILFTTFCLAAARDRARRPTWPLFLLGLLLLAQAGQAARLAIRPVRQMLRVENIDGLWFRYMLQRNLMLELKEAARGFRMRLILPAEMAPAVYYFGLGDSIGSLYWENLAGLSATAEFLGDPQPGRRAREIARERGITHVFLNKDYNDAAMFYHLHTGNIDRPGMLATLGGGLSDPHGGLVNDWLRQDYRLSLSASRSCSIHIPAAGQWISWNIPVRIQAVQTDRLNPPAAP